MQRVQSARYAKSQGTQAIIWLPKRTNQSTATRTQPLVPACGRSSPEFSQRLHEPRPSPGLERMICIITSIEDYYYM